MTAWQRATSPRRTLQSWTVWPGSLSSVAPCPSGRRRGGGRLLRLPGAPGTGPADAALRTPPARRLHAALAVGEAAVCVPSVQAHGSLSLDSLENKSHGLILHTARVGVHNRGRTYTARTIQVIQALNNSWLSWVAGHALLASGWVGGKTVFAEAASGSCHLRGRLTAWPRGARACCCSMPTFWNRFSSEPWAAGVQSADRGRYLACRVE